jgi:hypothetical protein
MPGLTGFALIPTQQTQAHPSGRYGRIEFEAGTEGGVGLFPVAAGGKDLAQDSQCIGVIWPLADYRLNL